MVPYRCFATPFVYVERLCSCVEQVVEDVTSMTWLIRWPHNRIIIKQILDTRQYFFVPVCLNVTLCWCFLHCSNSLTIIILCDRHVNSGVLRLPQAYGNGSEYQVGLSPIMGVVYKDGMSSFLLGEGSCFSPKLKKKSLVTKCVFLARPCIPRALLSAKLVLHCNILLFCLVKENIIFLINVQQMTNF